MRRMARRLMAYEAANPSASDVDVHEAVRVCEKLRNTLTQFAGAEGFASLLRRSLALAREDVPALDRITIKPGSSMVGLDALAAEDTDAGVEAGLAITSHLLELLVAFIGQPLTERLVREAWPNASLDE